MSAELAALGAALCWALGGMIATEPVRALGGVAFTRVRMLIVFAMLAVLGLFTGGWLSIDADAAAILLLSGLIGILLGDTALFATLKRLGPRRTGMLFACNAAITALLAWLLLGETLGGGELLGGALVVAGVVLSIAYGQRRSSTAAAASADAGRADHWERVEGALAVGVGLGLLAALGQSVGTLIAKPVMAAGVDPVAASALRIGTAAFGLQALRLLPYPAWRQRARLSRRWLALITASGVIGMGLGMTLLLFALRHGDTGLVAVLSATSPVLLLPLLWLHSGERPAVGAWLGALLAVAGTGLILVA